MRARLIPVLLLDRDRRLVKTVAFGERTYIGDPFNVIRLFNEKEVDEICVLDIDATRDGRFPDVGFVSELASECFMPLSFGGGLCPGAPMDALARAGVEKFIVSSHADDIDFVGSLVSSFGSQAVVGCVDYTGSERAVKFASGSRAAEVDALTRARRLVAAGAGEIILQSIDNDGMRAGMDIAGIRDIARELTVPVVALGGAGETDHLEAAIAAGASAAASGSAFCFLGRLRAVLVSYPTVQATKLETAAC